MSEDAPHPKGGPAEPAGLATPGTAPSTPATAAAPQRAASPMATAARRVGTEVRRTARGVASRTYLAVAVGTALLASLCGLAPVLAARALLPSNSPAFATREQTMAGEALSTVIEAARHGVSAKGMFAPSIASKTVGLVYPYDTLFRLVGASSAVWALVAFTLRKAAFANKLSLVTYKRLAMGLATVGGLEVMLLPRALVNLSWTGVAAFGALAILKVNSPARQVRGEGVWSLAKQCVRGMGFTRGGGGGRRGGGRGRRGRTEFEEEATRAATRVGGERVGAAVGAAASTATSAVSSMGGPLGVAYRLLAMTLASGGLAYLFAPAISSKLALGTIGTAPARLLWQVMGASSVGLSLLCLNLAMAAAQVSAMGEERNGWGCVGRGAWGAGPQNLSFSFHLFPHTKQGRLAATTHTLECMALLFTAITHILLLARDYEAGRWGIGGPGLAALWAAALGAAIAGMPASHPVDAMVGAVTGGQGGGGSGVATPVGQPIEYEGGGHED